MFQNALRLFSGWWKVLNPQQHEGWWAGQGEAHFNEGTAWDYSGTGGWWEIQKFKPANQSTVFVWMVTIHLGPLKEALRLLLGLNNGWKVGCTCVSSFRLWVRSQPIQTGKVAYWCLMVFSASMYCLPPPLQLSAVIWPIQWVESILYLNKSVIKDHILMWYN